MGIVTVGRLRQSLVQANMAKLVTGQIKEGKKTKRIRRQWAINPLSFMRPFHAISSPPFIDLRRIMLLTSRLLTAFSAIEIFEIVHIGG